VRSAKRAPGAAKWARQLPLPTIDEGLKNAITAQLTYNPSEPDPKLVANLQSNLVRLQSRFVQVGQVAAAELQFVSDGLADISATATAQTAKPNKTITAEEISEKSDSIKKSAFTGDAEPLNHENQQFMKKLKTSAAASSPIA